MSHRRHISPMSIALALGISWTVAAANGSMNWRLPASKNFPLVGGNWGNQRYSTLDQINRSNVKKLGGAWMMHLEDGKTAGNMQATPVVVDGVMFVSSGLGNVFAIDARRGALKWKYRSEATIGTTTNRGVVVAEGKVFLGQRDNTLIALDQQSGALIWKTRLAEAGRGFTSAPAAYFDGLVYIGVAGGEGGGRGAVGGEHARSRKG